jgi:integrase/recombinase XerD
MKGVTTFSALLEAFFLERLLQQRRASPHTIASYRDTFRLLLQYTQQCLRKAPSSLAVSDLTTELLGEFLVHLEKDRRNTARSRNVRLAAIHSFFRYVARQAPEYGGLAGRVLDMPSKRYVRRPIAFLAQVEIDALLAAPDLSTWCGRRDRALILLAVQTGLRAAELLALRCQDILLGSAAHVWCEGKGRKERCTPLGKDTVAVLRGWLRERDGKPSDPAFPTVRGTVMSHDALQNLLNKHVVVARGRCASLRKKHVTAHSLRHSLAMKLLQNGVDRSVIALWLGHESAETTDVYLHADMTIKERALQKSNVSSAHARRYHPDDRVMAFLRSLY